MKNVVGMINKTHMIEFPDTPDGLEQCKAYRKINSAFKGCHIRHYLQAYNLPLEKLLSFDEVDKYGK